MKKFILGTLMLSTAAMAADRSIFDIQYLPKAGTTYGFSDINYEKREIKAKSGDLDITGWRINQTLGHSFTDRLTSNLSMNFFEGERDPETGAKTDEEGLSDLVFNGRYRLMDEALLLDLAYGLQIEISESRVEQNNDVDNRYVSGGNKANIGLQVGEKKENMQWAFLTRYIHSFKRKIDFRNTTDIKIEPNRALQLRADLLNKLAEKSFIRSHFTTDFVERTEEPDGSPWQGAQTNYELGAEYQHLCSQDLLARAGIDYRMHNYESGDNESDNMWVFRIGANYQF